MKTNAQIKLYLFTIRFRGGEVTNPLFEQGKETNCPFPGGTEDNHTRATVGADEDVEERKGKNGRDSQTFVEVLND